MGALQHKDGTQDSTERSLSTKEEPQSLWWVDQCLLWVAGKGGSVEIVAADNPDIRKRVRVAARALPEQPGAGDLWLIANRTWHAPDTMGHRPADFDDTEATVSKKTEEEAADCTETVTEEPTGRSGTRTAGPTTEEPPPVVWPVPAFYAWNKNTQGTFAAPLEMAAIHRCSTGRKSQRRVAASFVLDGTHPLPEGTPLDTALAHAELGRWIQRWNGMARLWRWALTQDLPPSICSSLWTLWGEDSVDTIHANPYRLLAGLSNLRWTDVDGFAERAGLAPSDTRREQAAAALVMQRLLDEGDDTPLVDAVTKGIQRLLGVTPTSADALVVRMLAAGHLVERDRLDGAKGLRTPAVDALWSKLWNLADGPHRPTERHENTQGVAQASTTGLAPQKAPLLDPTQRAAVAMALEQRFSLLLGGAGTGKTSTVRGIHERAEHQGVQVIQCTISGRAARRLEESTGRPAWTVAKLLTLAQHKNIEATITGPEPLLVIDEVSMLDLATMVRLIHALPQNTRWCLVGDPGQLPPIGFGHILDALVTSPTVPRTVLTTVHRQAARTGIPAYAAAVQAGQNPNLAIYNGQDEGVFALPLVSPVENGAPPTQTFAPTAHTPAKPNPTLVLRSILALKARIPDIMILASRKGGALGVHAINQAFHRERQAFQKVDGAFLPGEPVVYTKNDPDTGLLNGSIGRVVASWKRGLIVDFEGETHHLTHRKIQHLELAYALTTHKAQGSQWRAVLVVSHPHDTIRMHYTQATRAEKLYFRTKNLEPTVKDII
jgi:exodeoxyribonuclease V alpha subunit